MTAPWTAIADTVAFAGRVSPPPCYPIHDAAITPEAYGIYWGHVERFAGVDAKTPKPRFNFSHI